MRYVLDSSVALKWVLQEPDSPKAVSLRQDYLNNVHELLAPDVLPIEVAHALARAERRKIINPPQGCLYVALADQEGCELVTADDKLVKNLKPAFPFIVPLASLP